MPTRTKPAARASVTPRTRIETIAVIGLGYVGLPLAVLAEARGKRVVGFDVDRGKIARLSAHDAPQLSRAERAAFRKSRMRLTDDEAALDGADAFLICVPTPVDDRHEPDLGPLIQASEVVGRHLRKGALVAVESTVNPGACESVVLPILERASGLVAEHDFFFAHCPERINPGDGRWNTRTIPRVVGGAGPESLARALALYSSIIEGTLEPMDSIQEAEAVKMVENAFRDVNIAFVNELAMSFSRAGIDLAHVLRGAGTKPFSFLPHYPGCGVGGHCIPVDPYYLIRYGKENGFEHRFLAMAREINNGMPAYTVDLVEAELESLGRPMRGATIALLGLAYKRGVGDLRESPALVLREELSARGAQVRCFDPYVPEESTSTDTRAALSGADAAVIATDHDLFRELTPSVFRDEGVPVVVDGRNCLTKDAFLASGVRYRGIGR